MRGLCEDSQLEVRIAAELHGNEHAVCRMPSELSDQQTEGEGEVI